MSLAQALSVQLPSVTVAEMEELLEFGDVSDTENVENLKGYLKIKRGITIDSGSAAFGMPTRWLPMFNLETSETQGQAYVGATGKIAKTERQNVVDFMTRYR